MEKQYSAKRKAKIEAEKAAIRADDMAKGVYALTSSLPKQDPQKGGQPSFSNAP